MSFASWKRERNLRREEKYRKARARAEIAYKFAKIKAESRQRKKQRKRYAKELRKRTFEISHPHLFSAGRKISAYENIAFRSAGRGIKKGLSKRWRALRGYTIGTVGYRRKRSFARRARPSYHRKRKRRSNNYFGLSW